MKLLIISLSVFLFAGCATSPTTVPEASPTTVPEAPPTNIPDTEIKDSYELSLTSQGGEYSKWTKQFNGGFCKARVRFHPESVSKHPKWASLGRVVLRGSQAADLFIVSARYDPEDKLFKMFIKHKQDTTLAWADKSFRMKESFEIILFNKKNSIDVSILPAERMDALAPGESLDLIGHGVTIEFKPVAISLIASGAEFSFEPIEITSGC